jgi:hypothetical protein
MRRLFLAPYDLTPTYALVHNKFSVKYYLNLVLVDEEDRRYFKQQARTTADTTLNLLKRFSLERRREGSKGNRRAAPALGAHMHQATCFLLEACKMRCGRALRDGSRVPSSTKAV